MDQDHFSFKDHLEDSATGNISCVKDALLFSSHSTDRHVACKRVNCKESYQGKWIQTHGVAYHNAKRTTNVRRGWPTSLVLERTRLLQKIPGWTWNNSENSASKPDDVKWMGRFDELSNFVQENDGSYPRAHWKRGGSHQAGQCSLWISTQLSEYKRRKLSDEKIGH